MLTNYLLIVLVGFLSAIAVTILFKNLALRYKFLISGSVTLVGGISMGLSFLLVSFFGFSSFAILSSQVAGIIIASMAIIVFGIVDDLLEMSILVKFLVQVIATAVLILFGVRTQIVGIGNIPNIVITFVWILGIANAFNHLDVIDGLAAGVAVIVGLAFFAVSLLNADLTTAILSLALATVAFSFLLFNLPPAKIYMGNSGSHFLGFVLGSVALLISYAPMERRVALLTPLLILGFPIIDTLMLIIIRTGKKIIPFKKSESCKRT